METKLSETRPQLATLLQSIGDAVIVTDGDGMILSMNPAAETTMGWTQEEVIGKAVTQVLQLVDEETLLPVEGHVFGALYEGWAMSLSRGWLLILRDGTALPIDLGATLVRDSHENFSGAILTLRGVAEPRRTVEAFQEVFQKVQQAKREWECTVDALSDVILLADNSGHVLRANRAVEDWSLGRVTEVGGRTVHDLIHHDCLDPDCYLDAFVRGALRQTTRGQTVGHEVYDQVLNRYLLLYAQPVRDPKHNAVQATVIVLQDITERKQTEEMLRQYAAELQARNEELDAFAHTVAHDLKNPVGLVMGYAEILLKDRVIAPNSDLAEGLHIIARTGRKMNDIIEELLLLAQVRNEPVQTEPLSMGSIVDEARQRLVRIIQECGAEIILPQDWPQASGYGPWVEEVWANYLSNALRYGGRRRTWSWVRPSSRTAWCASGCVTMGLASRQSSRLTCSPPSRG